MGLLDLFQKRKSPYIQQSTDAGMFCLYNYDDFTNIIDFESWEKHLLDDKDISNHIEKGSLVPINIGGDCSIAMDIRVNENSELGIRESKYLLETSKPYYFHSTGLMCISPIEHVEKEIQKSTYKVNLAKGDYKVIIHIIDWESEPGSRDKSGKSTKFALPDLVICVEKINEGDKKNFRQKLQTFERD